MAKFSRCQALAIAQQGEISREGALRALNSYKPSRLLNMLQQLESGGCAETLDVGDQVARLLGNQDAEVAAAAVRCLGRMGSKAQKYEQNLTDSLGHPSAAVRVAVAEALGHLASYLAKPEELAKAAVRDADAAVRAGACRAIGEMEATSLHESVAALLKDGAPEVQCAAIETISTFVRISPEMQSVYVPKIGDLLNGMLGSSRTKTAALDAVAILGEHAPTSCVAAAVAALGDEDIFTRQSAVSALSAISDGLDKATVEKVGGLLKGPHAGVRAAAASALAGLGESASSCAEALAGLLADDEEDASGTAYVMGNGGRRPPPQMRRPKCAALTALGRMGSEAHVAKISEALNDANWEVRLSAAESLAALKHKAKDEASALLGSMEDDAFPVRSMACFALGQLRDTEALPRLVEAFEDSAYSVRLCAVQAVAEMGDAAQEHCHEIFKLTDDPVAPVRAAALKALAALGPTGESYASIAAALLQDQDPEVRAAACGALAHMGAPGRACADEVEGLLGDPFPLVRNTAVSTLEGMGYYTNPFLKDFGRGPGVPYDGKAYWRTADEKPVGVLLPGETSFEGLGIHYSDILAKKEALQGAGKWIEGVL